MIGWLTKKFWGNGLALPVSAVVEPIDGPWINSQNWGNKIVSTPAVPVLMGAEGKVHTVLKQENLPGPPHVHTVQLFRGDFRPQLNADVRARVQYGIGGTLNEFFVDWGPGCQFSLACSSIQVDAVTFAPNANAAYSGAAIPLDVGVTVGRGTVAHGRPLVLTEPLRSIATNIIPPAAGSFFLSIPDFARSFIVRAYRNGGIAGALNTIIASEQSLETGLQLTLETQVGLAMFDAQIFAGLGETGIPIPGGANRLVIGNSSNLLPGGHRNLNAAYDFVVQWVLSL